MARQTEQSAMVTEHILEVRYTPTGSFLDVRGHIADHIKQSRQFPYWRIETNVVNFHDGEEKIEKVGAFVGFKNAGFVAYNADTQNFFQDKAAAFWRALKENGRFAIPPLQRVGVRTKVFLPVDTEFSAINERLCKTLLSAEAQALFASGRKDSQFVIDIDEEAFVVRNVLGPLKRAEAERFFSFKVPEFGSAGLFVDLDYFKTSGLDGDRVAGWVRDAMALTWARIEKIGRSVGL